MAMDINSLKARLAALQNPKAASGNSNKKEQLWKPTVGKHSIRIVPSAYNKQNPFTELMVHYNIGKTMIALTNFGENDPIVEFAQEVRKGPNWKTAGKLEPKLRIFAPVIVRGEEDKGVRLWEFSKQIYMELLSILEDEDVGDFTDPITGRDLTVETTSPEQNGTNYMQSKVRVRTKVTTLSDDADQVKLWLTTQPEPKSLYTKYTYEEMKDALLKHLDPEKDEVKEPTEQPDNTTTGDLPWEKQPNGTSKPAYTLNTQKDSVDAKIDELFDI